MSTDLRKYTADGGVQPNPAAPEPQNASPASGPGLAELRKIYVGKGFHRFEKIFEKFDAAGKIKTSFCLPAFLFTFFWFFYRKMYREGFVFLGAVITMIVLEEFVDVKFADIIVPAAAAFSAKGAYWTAANRQVARAGELYPNAPDQARAWLETKGGVNTWMVPIIVLMCGLSLYAVYDALVVSGLI